MSEQTIPETDLKKVEAELLAKKKAAEADAKAAAEKIAREAEARGREAAMREYEEEQRRKAQEEELKALREKASALEERLQKELESANKKFQEEFEKLKYQRQGVVRNESPFNSPASTDSSDPLKDPAVVAEINRKSAEAAAKAWGVPMHAWVDR